MEQTQLDRAAGLLKVLSNPVRLKLLLLLDQQGPSNCARLQGQLYRSQTSVSKHLNKLKAYGVVTNQRRGSQVHYVVSDPLMKQLSKDLWNRVVDDRDVTE